MESITIPRVDLKAELERITYVAREEFTHLRVKSAISMLREATQNGLSDAIYIDILEGRRFMTFSDHPHVETEKKAILSLCDSETHLVLNRTWVAEKLVKEIYDVAWMVNTGDKLVELKNKLECSILDSYDKDLLTKHFVKKEDSEYETAPIDSYDRDVLAKHFKKIEENEWEELLFPKHSYRRKMEAFISELAALNELFGTSFNTTPHNQIHDNWMPDGYDYTPAYVLGYMSNEQLRQQSGCSYDNKSYGFHSFSAMVDPEGKIYLDANEILVHLNNLEPAVMRNGWEKDNCLYMRNGTWHMHGMETISQLHTVLEWHVRFGLETLVVDSRSQNKVKVADVYAALAAESYKGFELGRNIKDIFQFNMIGKGDKWNGTKYQNLKNLRGNSKTEVPVFVVLNSNMCKDIYTKGLEALDDFTFAAKCSFRGVTSLEGKKIILRTSPMMPLSGQLPTKNIGVVTLEELKTEIVAIIKEGKDNNTFPEEWGFGFALGIQEYIESKVGGVVYNHHPITGKTGLFGECVQGDASEYNLGNVVGSDIYDVLTGDQIAYLKEVMKAREIGTKASVVEFIVNNKGNIIITQLKPAILTKRIKVAYFTDLYQCGKISQAAYKNMVGNIEIKPFDTDMPLLHEGLNLSVDDAMEVDVKDIFIGDFASPSDIDGYKGVIVTNKSLFNHTADLCREKGIPSVALGEIPTLEGVILFGSDGNLYQA